MRSAIRKKLSHMIPYFWCCMILIASLSSGCAGTVQLKSQLKTAQHERDVLRDAYEAQQLRLRELELRLLKLEDRQLIGQRETRSITSTSKDIQSGRPHSTPYLTSPQAQHPTPPQSSNQHLPHHDQVHTKATNSDRWREQRLRALPVVRVSAAQALSASGNLRHSSRERSTSHTIKKGSSRSRSSAQPTQSQRSKQSNIESVPTLTSHSLSTDEPRPADRQTHTPPNQSSSQELAQSQIPTPPAHSAHQPVAQPTSRSVSQPITSTDRLILYQQQVNNATSASERAPSLIKLATELRRRGQRAQAMRLMRRMISESPTHPSVPDALYLMGRLQIEQGEEANGRATLLRLSRLYPKTRAAQSARQFLSGGSS